MKNKTKVNLFAEYLFFIFLGLILIFAVLFLSAYLLTKNDNDFETYKYYLYGSVIVGTLISSFIGSLKIKNKKLLSALIISSSQTVIMSVVILLINSFSLSVDYGFIFAGGLLSGILSGLIVLKIK